MSFGSSIIRIKLKKVTLAELNVIYYFMHKRHSQEMGSAEIEAFLTHLAVEEHVAASTQNQA